MKIFKKSMSLLLAVLLILSLTVTLRRIAVRVHPNKAVKLISFNVWGYFRIGIHE